VLSKKITKLQAVGLRGTRLTHPLHLSRVEEPAKSRNLRMRIVMVSPEISDLHEPRRKFVGLQKLQISLGGHIAALIRRYERRARITSIVVSHDVAGDFPPWL